MACRPSDLFTLVNRNNKKNRFHAKKELPYIDKEQETCGIAAYRYF